MGLELVYILRSRVFFYLLPSSIDFSYLPCHARDSNSRQFSGTSSIDLKSGREVELQTL